MAGWADAAASVLTHTERRSSSVNITHRAPFVGHSAGTPGSCVTNSLLLCVRDELSHCHSYALRSWAALCACHSLRLDQTLGDDSRFVLLFVSTQHVGRQRKSPYFGRTTTRAPRSRVLTPPAFDFNHRLSATIFIAHRKHSPSPRGGNLFVVRPVSSPLRDKPEYS